MIDHIFLKRLRILGIIEGCSTLMLFGVAIPLKYLADMPLAVRIAGSVHGMLFLGLVAMLILAQERVPLPTKLMIHGLIGAVIPFGPFVADSGLRKLAKQNANANDKIAHASAAALRDGSAQNLNDSRDE